MLTTSQLAELILDPESDRVERKSSASDKNEICRAISAFANDLPDHKRPGVVLIGVHDDGRCAGLAIDDKLLRDLADLRSQGKLHPFPVMSVQERQLADCSVVVIQVEPSDNPPVKFDGRVWVRVGPSKRQATAEEERRLVEKRRWANLPFDQHGVPGVRLDDLDLARFERELRPVMVRPDVIAQNGRSIVDQMRGLRLLTRDGLPTVLAVLALAFEPRAYLPGAFVQFRRFAGTSLLDTLRDQHDVAGTLLDQFSQLDEILKLGIALRSDFATGRELRFVDYPLTALREIVFNAIIHRNYESSNTPTHLFWYEDRIEVRSPGGLYGDVTKESLGTGAVAYRNPAIAELAAQLGYAQRIGRGLVLAKAELETNGNPPLEFRIEPTTFHVTVRSRA